ncbi:MAG TPA: 4-hydroxy-3-methylbut-2-enyl diphosphate reductase, partial [Halieaceae bacterium]|nr:4-hydroxy-3-methylbut-2-enyl diphosphate reductase [Halieaceae bacterium]
MGAVAYLIDSADDIRPEWLQGQTRVGVTAGASAPEVLVNEVLQGLQALGANPPVELAGRPENVTFSLPRELRIPARNV